MTSTLPLPIAPIGTPAGVWQVTVMKTDLFFKLICSLLFIIRLKLGYDDISPLLQEFASNPSLKVC